MDYLAILKYGAVFVGVVLVLLIIDSIILWQLKRSSLLFDHGVSVMLGMVSLTTLFAVIITGWIVNGHPFFVHDLAIEHTDQSQTGKLEASAKQTRMALENVQNLTLGEIQRELTNALLVIGSLQQEALEKRKVVQELSAVIDRETAKASQAKQIAETVSSLSQPQIEAIALMLKHDAEDSSRKGFLIGLVTSFVLGVIGSWIANHIPTLLSKRR